MDTHIDSTHRLHDRTTRVPDAYNTDNLPHIHPYPCDSVASSSSSCARASRATTRRAVVDARARIRSIVFLVVDSRARGSRRAPRSFVSSRGRSVGRSGDEDSSIDCSIGELCVVASPCASLSRRTSSARVNDRTKTCETNRHGVREFRARVGASPLGARARRPRRRLLLRLRLHDAHGTIADA